MVNCLVLGDDRLALGGDAVTSSPPRVALGRRRSPNKLHSFRIPYELMPGDRS